MIYVIKRTADSGGWVADPFKCRSGHPYTRKLEEAAVYHTAAEAERDRNPNNEIIQPREELLR